MTVPIVGAGLSEHTNGLVRQYSPKWKEFKDLSLEEVRQVQELLNNRPRKALGYRIPTDALGPGRGTAETRHTGARNRAERGGAPGGRRGCPGTARRGLSKAKKPTIHPDSRWIGLRIRYGRC